QLRLTAAGGLTMGTTAVTLTLDGAAWREVTLRDGSATVVLPRDLAVGQHRFAVSFPGDATFAPAQAAATLQVTKAKSTSKVTLKPKSGKVKVTKRATVRIKVRAAALVPQGRVQVTVTRAKGKKVV